MKNLTAIALLSALAALLAGAQVRSTSPAKPFGTALVIESGLHTDGGDTLLEAGEHARLLAMVTNTGSVAAGLVRLSVCPEGTPRGITLAERHDLGTLAAGESKELVVEFVVGDSVPAQHVRLELQVSDGSGRTHPVDTLRFSTASSMLPKFRLAWHLEHPEDGIVEAAAPGDTVYIVLCLENAGGAARGVSLHLDALKQSRLLDWTDTLLVVGKLAAGDSVSHRILVAVDHSPREDSARARVMVLEERDALTQHWEIACPLAGTAELSLLRGTAAFQRGEIETALEFYTHAVKHDPSLAQAHLLQGLVYEYMGDKKRCVPAIQRAANLGDSTAIAWLAERKRVHPPAVKYVRLKPDPFADAGKGAGLAVLPFERTGGSDVADRVYRKLASSAKARERFTLYSAASLEEQQDALGLTSLDPESEAVRRALLAVDIQYVLYGAVAAEFPLAISLRCLRTDDGSTLLDQKLRESTSSTALDDAIRLIAEGRKPVYQER